MPRIPVVVLVLAASCSDVPPLREQPSPSPLLLMQQLVPVGGELVVRWPRERCILTWRLRTRPEGSTATLAISADLRTATVVPDLPGEYRVEARSCLGTQAIRARAFAPTATLEAVSISEASPTCNDLAVGGRHLLCLDGGIGVVDLASGAIAAHTEERLPSGWGLDASGSLFAAATYGCSACAANCGEELFGCLGCCSKPVAAGTRLYSIDAEGRPKLESFLPGLGEEVALAPGLLAATGNGGASVFDVTDPAHPRLLWSVPGAGLPAFAGPRLHLLSFGTLTTWDHTRPPGPAPLSTVPAPRTGGLQQPPFVVAGDRLLVGAASGLALYRDGAAGAVRLDQIDQLAVDSIASDATHFYVATAEGLYVFPIDADTLQPDALLDLRVGEVVVIEGVVHALGDDIWRIDRRRP